MEKFLNGKKNNIISEEIGGSYKVINTWGAVGEKMNPRNMWFLMQYFYVLGMPDLPGFLLGKKIKEKSLSRLKKERKKKI